MRRLLAPALALAVTLAVPGGAFAQAADGVDPDSPSGYEYAIPLERAREEASPSRGPGAAESDATEAPAPPFGAGVEPPTGGATGEGERRGSPGENGNSARSRRDAPGAAANTADPEPRLATAVPTPQAETGDVALIGAAGGAVLLLGAIGGLALRRRSG